MRFYYKNIFEIALFFLTVIILFNTLTDFAYKLRIVSEILKPIEMQYFGFLSYLLGVANIVSDRFFGFSIMQN